MKLQRDSLISLIVGAVLFVLLPLLAALQYRWLGQVSEGEREQMKAGLQATARRISEDFDQELTRAFVTYLSNADQLSDEGVFAERHQRWLETAHDPRLVKAVFVASDKETDNLVLREFNATDNRFSAQAWPEELKPLQSQLDQRLQVTRAAFAERPPKMPPPPNLSPIFNGDLSALVMPITKIPQLGSGEQTPEIFGYAIVQLDVQFIQQEMLPNLVKQHLDVNKYALTIQSRGESKKTIWQSAATDYSNADTAQPLFGLRVSEIVRLRNQKGQQPTQNPVTPRLGGGGGGGFGGGNNGDNRAWELRIRHRAGSLEAAVAQIRRRNLLISSSILLLLVASVMLLMMSVRRAKRLAQQQMDFVAGVSHELRTPLAVIDSAGYNLTKGVVKDPARIAHYGSLIRKETHRLQEMVEQILEFAGVQSGKQKYELQPTNVNQVIADVLSASQPLLTEGSFQLDADIAPNLPAVMADSPALGRALQNLLNNAMKYGGESRWIGVNAQAVANPKGAEVRITVADRGLGISAEDQRHIFEPFYRGSEVKAAQIHGNGLGLSLVKNIITAHNGRITVESTEGKGSQFTIALPTIAEEVLQASPLEANTSLRV